MRPYRVVSIYALLVWAYVVARILAHPEYMGDPFIDGIPIPFWAVGLGAFVVSFVAEFIGAYRS